MPRGIPLEQLSFTVEYLEKLVLELERKDESPTEWAATRLSRCISLMADPRKRELIAKAEELRRRQEHAE